MVKLDVRTSWSGLFVSVHGALPTGGRLTEWALFASPTCWRNGPGSERCSAFLPAGTAFEPSLWLRLPLFPGNGQGVEITVGKNQTAGRKLARSGVFGKKSREISVRVRLRGGGRSPYRTRLSNKIPC
jgi:hypothetical protein